MLWTMVLLAVLGGTITAAGRSEARIASNLLAAAQIRAAADGAVSAAMFHLLAPPSGDHWAPDGAMHQLMVGPAAVGVMLADQDGMIDPNQAPPSLIASLLREQGVDDTTANSVAQAVVDWRSPGDAGLGPVYQAERRAFGPPHESFQSVEELALVAYVTPQLMALLRPHIDPFIEATPDPNLADPVVAAAIADAVKRDNLTLDPISADGPSIVLVTATARSQGAVFTRRALVRFDATGANPFAVLEWRQG